MRLVPLNKIVLLNCKNEVRNVELLFVLVRLADESNRISMIKVVYVYLSCLCIIVFIFVMLSKTNIIRHLLRDIFY